MRRPLAVVLIVGGWGWHEAWDWYKGTPSHDKMEQYDAGLRLIPEFYLLQAKVSTLEQKLDDSNTLGERDREEIKQEIRDLRQDLQKWFLQAGGGGAGRSR